jgi:uncharacterized protein
MISSLQVHITDNCNLACPYCFNLKRSSRHLTARNILYAIDKIFHSGKNDYYLHFIGGEPLLYWYEIKKVLRYLWIKNGFVPNHSVTTNGTKMNPQVIEEFRILQTKVTLSLEGKKERHQSLRIPFSDSRYEALILNTRILLSSIGTDNVIARLTLYQDWWEVSGDIEFLSRLGIRRFKILPDLNLSQNKCSRALTILTARFADKILNGSLSIFPLDDQLIKSNHGACGVGEKMICLAPDENFYPCHRFVYYENLILGNIKNGIHEISMNTWAGKIQKLRKVCQTCTNVSYCNFPCAYPDPEKIDSTWCQWMQGSLSTIKYRKSL